LSFKQFAAVTASGKVLAYRFLPTRADEARGTRRQPEEDLVETQSAGPGQTMEPLLPPLARRPGTPPTVLVVEDDAEMRALLEEILTEEGFRTVAAADALAALIALFREGADVMITDWKMPAMDGLNLLRSVRRCTPRLPVVFITAFAQPDLRRRAFEGGARSFLPKPFQRRDLVTHVRAALGPVPA
jgi:CheY-like chemotaxis protein